MKTRFLIALTLASLAAIVINSSAGDFVDVKFHGSFAANFNSDPVIAGVTLNGVTVIGQGAGLTEYCGSIFLTPVGTARLEVGVKYEMKVFVVTNGICGGNTQGGSQIFFPEIPDCWGLEVESKRQAGSV